MKPDGYNPSQIPTVGGTSPRWRRDGKEGGGQRFLIISASDDTSAADITVAVNGPAGPKQ